MKRRRVLTALLAFSVAGAVMSGVTADSANWTSQIGVQHAAGKAAARIDTKKEEVVYGMLSPSGMLEGVQIVNRFGAGRITDYGEYRAVKGLNTEDEITLEGERVTAKTTAPSFYYQGTSKRPRLPWTVQIDYKLDGETISPEALAGKSGKVEIHLRIAQDTTCPGDAFNRFALQTTVTMNSERWRAIEADGATIVNAGGDKQLIYTALPGRGMEATIRAEVSDAELERIAINGIRMRLNLDINDPALREKVEAFRKAIDELDYGATALKLGTGALSEGAKRGLSAGSKQLKGGISALHGGTGKLKDGGQALEAGASAFSGGISELDDGMRKLHGGIDAMGDGLIELNRHSGALTAGSSEVKAALEQIADGLSGAASDAEALDQLITASGQIKDGLGRLAEGLSAFRAATGFDAFKAAAAEQGLNVDELIGYDRDTAQKVYDVLDRIHPYMERIEELLGDDADEMLNPVREGLQKLDGLARLLEGNARTIEGMGKYLDTLGEHADELLDGAKMLSESYDAFDRGIGSLVGKLKDLTVDMSRLSEGLDSLLRHYEAFDRGISDYTDGVGKLAAGYTALRDGSSMLVEGSGMLRDNVKTFYGGTAELAQGLFELYDATGKLDEGAGKLSEGVDELLKHLLTLYDGMTKLSEGTAALYNETAGPEGRARDRVKALLDEVLGGDEPVRSFASEKNGRIIALQFVLRTDPIRIKKEKLQTEEIQQKENFFEKLFKLFGF